MSEGESEVRVSERENKRRRKVERETVGGDREGERQEVGESEKP